MTALSKKVSRAEVKLLQETHNRKSILQVKHTGFEHANHYVFKNIN